MNKKIDAKDFMRDKISLFRDCVITFSPVSGPPGKIDGIKCEIMCESLGINVTGYGFNHFEAFANMSEWFKLSGMTNNE